MENNDLNDNKQTKVAVILGGNLTPERRKEAAEGKKPRVDAMEMELRFQAKLFDYYWLEQDAAHTLSSKLLITLAKRVGIWSEVLALRVLPEIIKFDVIFATGEDVGLPLAVLLRFIPGKKPKLILRTEQPIYGRTSFRRSVFKRLLGFGLDQIDFVFTRTEAHADFIKKNFRISKAEICFVPETTDTKFFHLSEVVKSHPTNELISEPFIMSAGLEMRDYDLLISAARGLPVKVLICAGSPWAKVRFQPSNGDIPENVIVKSFNQTEMREVYRSAALVVLPIKPTMRACGMNVVLEAWASGRAVVASRTEGLSSYIHDQEDGYFVTPGNTDELRNKIQFLLDHRGEADRLGKNGHQRVNQDFYMERYLKTIQETITRLTWNGK